MADIITLSCPNCTTKLIIKNEGIKQFICNTCGHEYLIKREGGITYLVDVEQNIVLDEKNNQTRWFKDLVIDKNTDNDLRMDKPLMGIEYEQTFQNSLHVDIVKRKPFVDEKKNVEQIDKKISKLQIIQNGIQQNYAKSKITYTVLCLVTLAIIYAVFPIFDSYNDLFIAIGVTFTPVILVFVIYFLINRKAALSNQQFIETTIINTQKEKNNLE